MTIEARPSKPDGHDYHRCKCERCGEIRRWMKRRYDERRRADGRICAVEGCEKRCTGASCYCGAHHGRKARTGSVGCVESRTNDGTARSYQTAHNRLRLEQGPASEKTCADCGQQAADWSLRRDAEVRLVAESGQRAGLAFSPLSSDYEPRCKPCHAAYDEWSAKRGQRGAHEASVPA